ncbi:MAG TPA: glycosyltransferase family 4 protein [Solirubrobacteraceae bacterium]|nr:glycosyltransferase family 4 protein [Solirubrobacteraceae bacterium]
MRLQLWSYNYAPEPQGIAPLSTVLARTLRRRGHDVLVVAAHPHYPSPVWGPARRPYRERRDGVEVLRLPLWIGRDTGRERLRQEATFALAQTLVSPLLPRCDALVAVSPSFPALAPAMAYSRLRRIPWVMWLQDIVTDAAQSTGLLPPGRLLAATQRFERAAYADAARVVVISDAFRRNLLAKGVPERSLVRVFNPMSVLPEPARPEDRDAAEPRIVVMGNIGHSQGLDRIVEAFEGSAGLAAAGARLVIVGHGVEAERVGAAIRGRRVEMRGVLVGEALEAELRRSSIALVSQRADVAEFNLPSKLMNYMAFGLPVLASVRPESETARIVRDAGAGWVTDAADPDAFARQAADALGRPDELAARGAAARAFALENFHPERVAEAFERVLEEVVAERRRR